MPEAWQAVALGGLGAAALLVGTGVELWLHPKNQTVGLLMGFGTGALLCSVAYELVPEAAQSDAAAVLGLVLGALVFYVGDIVIDRRGGRSRKAIGEAHPDSQGSAIFLGTLLDGVPESLVLGMGVAFGEGANPAFVVAVFVSNLPEAMAATSSMRDTGVAVRRIWAMWGALVAASALAAGIGFVLAGELPAATGGFAQAFAAGAILTMLVDSMIPEAYKWGGNLVGLATVLGFITSIALSVIGLS